VPRLADIAHQDRAVAVVRAALAHGRLHHALLLTGPPAADKRGLALAIAAALNCETAPGEGCTTCAACTRIDDGVHPDVITLAREGAAQIIPIESVRTQVVAAVGLPPHEARERVFLFDEVGVNTLQPAAANTLLKTLEEPPARTRFILMTVAPDQLLPTIRSRCQRVSLAAPTAGARRAEASDADPVAAMALELCLAIDGGAGAALRVAQRAIEEKIDAAAVIELAAVELHARARTAIAAGDAARARRDAACAGVLLAAYPALEIHNAHGGISLEAVMHRLQRGLA
jgi:DNA polymerase-3 subunit delta'